MPARELSSTPGMTGLYARAVAGATVLPALRLLPGLGSLTDIAHRQRELPDLELRVPDIEVDREHLAAYDRVCGFRLRDVLPATYPHMLAFPLAMRVMTDASFPFGVMGLVHIANRIEQLRPLRLSERLTLRVWAADLASHDRGKQFDLVAEASADDQVAWRSRSTYLHTERRAQEGKGGKEQDKRPEPPRPDAEWRVGGDIGRRYAAVSGDRNPIHMHPLASRLFGMPKPIAHGMWLKARCLAALESLAPEAFAVEVRFKLPVFLPARLAFASWPDGKERGFAVHRAASGKPHLEGRLEPR